jgi:hypothetical protein
VCTKARMDVLVSCVAQALLLCRVVHRRFMFSSKELHQELRRRRWRRLSTSSFGKEKEVQPPRAVSSRAGQEGGCGVEGKQDLKTVNMRGAIVDIPPPFRADPHALGTTLFKGGRMIWARRRR